jgi:hypothetical protein
MWGALSDERTGLSFTDAAGPHQRNRSRVQVPRVSWPHFCVSYSRPPQPGGAGSRNIIPQEEGGPVILPGTGFPLSRLLQLAGPQWMYSKQPPPKVTFHMAGGSRYIDSARTAEKTSPPTITPLLCVARPLSSSGYITAPHSCPENIWHNKICHKLTRNHCEEMKSF